MAEDDLDALGSLAEKATNAVFRLTQNPRRGRTKVGVLRGVRALEFSMPGGQYRAAYVVQESHHRCVVFMIGPHENFYREAERRYRLLKKRGDLELRVVYQLALHRPSGEWYAF